MAGLKKNINELIQLNKEFYLQKKELRKSLNVHDELFFKNLPNKIFNDAEIIFVLSTGRCGTELLTKILNSSSGIQAYHNPPPELIYPSRIVYQKNQDAFEEIKMGVFMSRYDIVEKTYLRGKKYVETNCKITFFAPQIKSLFKKAKFIHLIREPVGFVNSAIRRGYYQSESADRGHIFPKDRVMKEKWHKMSLVEKITWNWLETNNYIESFKKTLDEEDYITIYSSDLFSKIETSKKIINFCKGQIPNDKKLSKIIKVKYNKSRKNKKKKLLDQDKILIKKLTSGLYEIY